MDDILQHPMGKKVIYDMIKKFLMGSGLPEEKITKEMMDNFIPERRSLVIRSFIGSSEGTFSEEDMKKLIEFLNNN